MKNIALIYSGDSSGLDSLQHNRDNVQDRLRTAGIWQTDINRVLESQDDLIKDLGNYKDQKIDRLLLYYTGHGTHTGTKSTFCLKLSPTLKLNIQTVIDCITDTFNDNDTSLPQTIAIVLDACYSGQAIEDIVHIEGIEILTSSLALKESFENNPHSNMSLFSHFFCEAIEELPNQNEIVNLQNISTYISSNVTCQKSLFSMVSKGGVAMQVAPYKKKKNNVYTHMIMVFFIPLGDYKYRIQINQDILFDNEEITIFPSKTDDKLIDQEKEISASKTKIVEEIKRYMEDMVTNIVELVLPRELYSEDIALWKDNNNIRLINHCHLVIRSYAKTEMSKKVKQNAKKRWDTCYSKYKDHSLKSASVCTTCEVGMDTDKISTIVEERAEPDKSTFYGIDNFYFIAFWINDCNDIKKYKNFISAIIAKPLNTIPHIIRSHITPKLSDCSSHINFMWDNPNTLPKAHYEQN